MYIGVWGNFAHVSTILPLDIAAVLDGVVYLVIHVINQIMNGWKLPKNVLYFIQYVTLKYNHIEYQSFTYWCILFFLFYSYLHSNKITTIKSDPFNNFTKVYRLSMFLLLYPPQQSCRGVFWYHHVRPSFRPSVDKSYVIR
jgi:hypothetical protein